MGRPSPGERPRRSSMSPSHTPMATKPMNAASAQRHQDEEPQRDADDGDEQQHAQDERHEEAKDARAEHLERLARDVAGPCGAIWRGAMAATTAPAMRTATAQPRYSSTRKVPRTPTSTSIDPCMSSTLVLDRGRRILRDGGIEVSGWCRPWCPGPSVDMRPDGDQRVHRCRGTLEGDIAVDHDHQAGVPGHGHVALDPDHDGRARCRVEGQVLADTDEHAPFVRGALGQGGGRQQQHQRHDQDRAERQQSGHVTPPQRSVLQCARGAWAIPDRRPDASSQGWPPRPASAADALVARGRLGDLRDATGARLRTPGGSDPAEQHLASRRREGSEVDRGGRTACKCRGEVIWHLQPLRGVEARPRTVRLGSFDGSEARGCHPLIGDQPLDTLLVRRGPHTARLAWREVQPASIVVEPPTRAVDPAEAECFLDGRPVVDGRPCRSAAANSPDHTPPVVAWFASSHARQVPRSSAGRRAHRRGRTRPRVWQRSTATHATMSPWSAEGAGRTIAAGRSALPGRAPGGHIPGGP